MENPMKLHIKNVHETKEKDQKLDIERNFKCPECHSKFVAKNSATAENIMKLHLEICSPKQKLRSKPKTTDFKTKDKAKNFQCEICSQIYSINTDLIEHKLDIHENKMLRKCPYCYLEYRGKTRDDIQILIIRIFNWIISKIRIRIIILSIQISRTVENAWKLLQTNRLI